MGFASIEPSMLGLRPTGGSFVILIPFYRMVVGNADDG